MDRLLLVVALWGCGSKEADAPAAVPDDHALHRTNSKGRLQIVGKAVPLASQPTMEWFGLPMSGDVDVAIDIKHPYEPTKTSGSIRISCPAGCRLGDDKTPLKPSPRDQRASAFAGEIKFGHIAFDSFTIVIDIADGKAEITTFDVVSRDVVLKAAGTIELAEVLESSRVDVCLRFGPGPDLERQPTTHAALVLTGAPVASDGLFNIKLTDNLRSLKKLGVVCDGTTPPPRRPSLPAAGSDDPSPSADDDAALAKRVEAAVKQTGDTTFEVDQATWDKLLGNPMALAKGARLVPAFKDGNQQGFKIYAIRPASLYARLGLVNGDTITTIAGESIASADKMLELYTKVRKMKPGERVDVEIVRQGAPVTQTYTLK